VARDSSAVPLRNLLQLPENAYVHHLASMASSDSSEHIGLSSSRLSVVRRCEALGAAPVVGEARASSNRVGSVARGGGIGTTLLNALWSMPDGAAARGPRNREDSERTGRGHAE
jgi:hypothetical protein